MSKSGTLLNTDAALRFIDTIDNSVTRTLVNMAFVQFVRRAHTGTAERPAADLDALYLVTTLADFFGEHDVLSRTLGGEKVGAWFDESVEA